MIAGIAQAIDAYTARDVRDPVRLRARLDSDFATVAAGVGVAAVTNVTAQTATVSGTVTPQTATVSVTVAPGSGTSLTNVYDGVTNVFTAYTNWTASFTGLTNVTVTVPGVTTNVTKQTN